MSDDNMTEWTSADRRKSKSAVILLLEKYVLPLAVAVTVAMASSALLMWRSVDRLTDAVARHDKEIGELRADLRADVAALRMSAVTRQELLETLKRVEQQLEIVMLRSGAKLPPGSIALTK